MVAVTAPPELRDEVVWRRLEDQIAWYERNSQRNRRWYLWIKSAQLILAATIPLIAPIEDARIKVVMAVLGALIALFEAFQQLFRFSSLWTEYRAVVEGLQRERALFLARAGAYNELTPEAALPQLAERVEELLAAEQGRWLEARRGNSTGT